MPDALDMHIRHAILRRSMLIGLLGKARCGKDVLADHLVGHGFVKCHFATPLKDACRVLFDLSEDQLHGDAKDAHDPRLGTTPRRIMQVFGTDVMRARFERSHSHGGDVVVADVRFANEVEAIKRLGGVVIKVERPGMVSDDDHVSERVDALDGVDFGIVNDGSIEQYLGRADALLGAVRRTAGTRRRSSEAKRTDALLAAGWARTGP